MPLTDRAEEILERLWQEKSEKNRPEVGLATVRLEDRRHAAHGEVPFEPADRRVAVQELLNQGLVELRAEKWLSLTEEGEKLGEQIIRNHRLAERLLADVFNVSEEGGDAAACQFEHILKRGLDERICTLLGHPRFCPHGLPIPMGECCKERRDAALRIVSPLADLEEGERGTIAYLHTGEQGKMDRLLALGVLPGQPIALLQRYPSYVFRVGQTQVAVDAELAKNIFVRLGAEPPARRKWRRRGLALR